MSKYIVVSILTKAVPIVFIDIGTTCLAKLHSDVYYIGTYTGNVYYNNLN